MKTSYVVCQHYFRFRNAILIEDVDRYRITSLKGELKLCIIRAKTKDSGVFKCRIENKVGWTSCDAKLIVKGNLQRTLHTPCQLSIYQTMLLPFSAAICLYNFDDAHFRFDLYLLDVSCNTNFIFTRLSNIAISKLHGTIPFSTNLLIKPVHIYSHAAFFFQMN